ncbi:MAG: tripartite tricarboxylate transporter substrate binding protein, partial [Rhodospirillales bacterium]|nr:tripartite tricarboxylate transporter substrate binding protein [Rhodospirillales bacterium]
LIAHLRANPGGASVGHAGNGTTNHITLMRLQDAAGVKFNVVPYRGSGPALNDLIAGQIDSCVDQVSSSLAHIKAGKLRPLAVTTAARVRDLPDVPTLQELGLKDFESVTAAGLVAPAKTPPPVLAALNAALAAALADPGVRQRLSEMGADPRPMTPAQFDAFMVAEAAALEPLFASGVLKPE